MQAHQGECTEHLNYIINSSLQRDGGLWGSFQTRYELGGIWRSFQIRYEWGLWGSFQTMYEMGASGVAWRQLDKDLHTPQVTMGTIFDNFFENSRSAFRKKNKMLML